MINIWVCFIIPVQKFRRLSPTKFLEPKTWNLARFYTTSDFDREYLRNETRYPKSGKTCDRERFLQRSAKQVRWTLVYYPESRICEFGPTQIDFSGDHISAPMGCWPLKFLHALEFDQALLEHTTNWVPQIFLGQTVIIEDLKFSKRVPITVGVVGVPSCNFTRWCGSRLWW